MPVTAAPTSWSARANCRWFDGKRGSTRMTCMGGAYLSIRTMPEVVLLGPQRLKPTLVQAFRDLRVEGPVAAVTAGWEEREEEIDELSEHLARPVENLSLH